MKRIIYYLSIVVFINLISCQKMNYQDAIKEEIKLGNFTRANEMVDSLLANNMVPSEKLIDYLFIKDSLNRVAMDFNKSRSDVIEWIENYRGFRPSDSLLDHWEQKKWLEFKIIDNEKRYFRNAAPNVFRVSQEARLISQQEAPTSDVPRDELLIEALDNMTKSDGENFYRLPAVKMQATYTLTVKANEVEEGKTVKAWLPFPRNDLSRQFDVKLIDTSQEQYILDINKTEHNSIYMEQKAVKDMEATFWVKFEFTSQGQWFDIANLEWAEYDKSSDIYKTYTAERPPHLLFSKNIVEIADSVTKNATTKLEMVKELYHYVANNYPWASAIEYSTIPNIPAYAIEYQKGDCGQVALLLINLLRYKGIPARWQSGWMMHPGEVNLHDWAEFYIENIGWVPIDISFARGGELNHPIGREFFMSGIDSYRLYLNSDYSGQFHPNKTYPRSESVDFQRGEVETDDYNLYFNQWRYKMEVEYK